MENNYSANIPLDKYHALIEKATLYDKVINDPSAKLVVRFPGRYHHNYEFEVYHGEDYIEGFLEKTIQPLKEYAKDLELEIERLQESNKKFREVFDLIKNQ
jgi:hypothetical protein